MIEYDVDKIVNIDKKSFVKYGLLNDNIDVTKICREKCIINNRIVIPAGDINRIDIFGDPNPYFIKSIFVIPPKPPSTTHIPSSTTSSTPSTTQQSSPIKSIKEDIPNQKVILFTNARNELRIKEWCAHHLLLGFDKIIIFDHLSQIPLKNILYNFDKRVTVIDIHKPSDIKLLCIRRAFNIAKELNSDWLLYIDADEFLVLNNYTSVKHIIDDFSIFNPSIGCIFMNWCFFGTNYHIREQPGIMFDNYIRCYPRIFNHVKSLVKLEKIKSPHNPHIWDLLPETTTYLANKTLVHPNDIKEWGTDYDVKYNNAPFYLAHYIYQSEETYILRKINVPTDNSSTYRKYDENIHKHYNDVENTSIRDKYSAGIKSFLKGDILSPSTPSGIS